MSVKLTAVARIMVVLTVAVEIKAAPMVDVPIWAATTPIAITAVVRMIFVKTPAAIVAIGIVPMTKKNAWGG